VKCKLFLFQTYEIRGSHQRHDQVVASVVFTNLTSNQIKDLELNVLDSLNAKLIRGVSLHIYKYILVS
jgi:AP-3 complex subunit delta-1